MKDFYLQLTSKAGNEMDIPTWVLLIETIASYQLELCAFLSLNKKSIPNDPRT
jgi:hypothetical protein